MPRGKVFAVIAIVSTVFLTAGIATAHGRHATARVVHTATAGHAAGRVHVARIHFAKPVRAQKALSATDTPPPPVPPTTCVESDDDQGTDNQSGDDSSTDQSGSVDSTDEGTDATDDDSQNTGSSCDDQEDQNQTGDQGTSGDTSDD